MTVHAARPLIGVAILAFVVLRVGVGPFVDGISMIGPWSLAAAFALGALTTACCAWRWSVVAHGLGVGVPLRPAIAAYYRSQFINTTVPGGVVGDAYRAVDHGREVGDVGRGVRAVAWERTAGQAVQVLLTVIVLLLLPSPLRSSMPVAVLALTVAVLVVVVLGRRPGTSRWSGLVHAAVTDVREGVLARRAWPAIVVASVLVVAGHTGTFLIAARTAGLTSSTVELLPLALVVLVAMAVPLSVGGWGVREGAAAWAFAMAGLGAAAGVTTAAIYGVLALVASLPGAVLLIVSRRHRTARPTQGATHA